MVKPSPCGTWRGYKRHLAVGETACEPCKVASRERSRAYWDRNREQCHERQNARNAAKRAAAPPKVPQVYVHTCPVCLTHYDTTNPLQVYCGVPCRSQASHDRERPKAPVEHVHGLLRPVVDGLPVAGPSKLTIVHCRKAPTGGLWVFCPWCRSHMEYQSAGDLWCRWCDLMVTLMGDSA